MGRKTWSKWTPEILESFQKDYPTCEWEELLDKYPFSKLTMSCKASELGLRRLIGRPMRYSKEDDAKIIELFEGGASDTEIGNILNRTTCGIKTRRQRLGLLERPGCWTDEENQILYMYYDKMPAQDVSAMLCNRSRNAVVAHAMLLGLKGYRPYIGYTDEDERFIAENYLSMSDEDMGAALGHPRASIKNRRNKLGLHRPAQQTQYDDIISYFRKYNTEWKKQSMQACRYRCIVTSERFDDIHHITSLNTIVKRAIAGTVFDSEDFDINIASKDEKHILVNLISSEQSKCGLGLCLKRNIHTHFHNIYGYGDNTPEQFMKFIKEYYPNSQLQI